MEANWTMQAWFPSRSDAKYRAALLRKNHPAMDFNITAAFGPKNEVTLWIVWGRLRNAQTVTERV